MVPDVFARHGLLQDEPCTEQLYVLCDLSIATIKGLVEHMGISRDVLSGHYPGSVTLPKGLYRPLEKDERGKGNTSVFSRPKFACLVHFRLHTLVLRQIVGCTVYQVVSCCPRDSGEYWGLTIEGSVHGLVHDSVVPWLFITATTFRQ